VFYQDRAPVLYRDQLGGRYTVEAFQRKCACRSETSGCRLRRHRADRPRPNRCRWQRPFPAQSESVKELDTRSSEGVRSLKLAQDALVEIKAGALYRRQFYNGVPLTLDTGDYASVDVVRNYLA